MKHKTLLTFVIGILGIAAVVVLIVVNKNRPDNVSVTPPSVTDSGESKFLVTKEPKMVSVAEDSYLLGVGGSYPQFDQADTDFNKKIADTVTKGISDFKISANEDYKARVVTGGDEFKKQFEQGDFYTYKVSTDLIQSNDNYISVLIRVEGYSGGAHGYHVASSYNYDVKNHKELSLTDFMTLKKASDESRKQLKEKFSKEENSVPEEFYIDGTDPSKPENFTVFTFLPKTVTLYFNEYQVAPYVFGEQRVEISR
jgi:hypothetical protein